MVASLVKFWILILCFIITIMITIQQETSSIAITFPNQNPIIIYQKNNSFFNNTFFRQTQQFNCSLSRIYTYRQSPQQLIDNTNYTITLSDITQTISVSITSLHNIAHPNLNQTTCQVGSSCILSITNNCPNPVSIFNYFDRMEITLPSFPTITYYVICNSSYLNNSFQWGIVIEIIFCTILITITAIYSRAWSIKGNGVTINIYMIVVFMVLIIIGGIIGFFSMYALNIITDILSWIFGILAICICTMQILFLLKIKKLTNDLFDIKLFKVNLMNIIGLFVGVGGVMAWWFSGKNWILNDLVFVCLTISIIKIFKFTTLKMAIICFFIFIVVEMVFVLIIQLFAKQSYNNVLLNLLNAPFQLQIPTINAVYNQKCSWLSLTAVLYPGILMSYLRRFDTSRNTIVYLTINTIVFIIGSFIWMVISLFSPFSLPFGLISQPAILTLVILFAYQRKQIRTLWDGLFYDQQFANKQSIKALQQNIAFERRQSELSEINKNLTAGLQINDRQDSQIQAIPYNIVQNDQL